MRVVAILLAVTVLGGCVTSQGVDDAVAAASHRLETICRVEPGVHLAFLLLANDERVSPRIVRAEAQAHAVVTAVCSNPPENVPAALVTAAEAYAAVLEASAKAEGV